jgi:hypothetical protein
MEINDPRIEAYFNDELSTKEAAAFLEEAKKFPAVWKEIQFRQWVINGIQDEGKIELKEFISNRLAEEREDSTGKFWYAAAAIAITVVVGFGIAWPYINSPETRNEYAADSSYNSPNQPSEEPSTAFKNSNPGFSDTFNPTVAMNSNGVIEEIQQVDENVDDVVAMEGNSENSSPPDAVAQSYSRVDYDDNKRNAPVENDISSQSLSRSKGKSELNTPLTTENIEKEVVQIASFQVIPIDPMRSKNAAIPSTKKSVNSIDAISIRSKAKATSKVPAATSNQQVQNNNAPRGTSIITADTTNNSVLAETNNANNLRKFATSKDNFTIVLTRSDGNKPMGITKKEVTPQGTQYSIILNNFGDANALLYKLGNAYYLGINDLYYQIDMMPGRPWIPQKVTNKTILEQLNP